MAITVSNMINGSVQQLSPVQLATLYGAGNIRTPSKNFALNFRHHHVVFTSGVPVVVDASLAAALTAAGAPVV